MIIASRRVIEANGGTLIERFYKPAAYGGAESLRFRILVEGVTPPRPLAAWLPSSFNHGVVLDMNRRDALRAVFLVVSSTRAGAAAPAAVSTLIGTGSPGFSDREVNNPYGLTIGPDRGLYFCDLDNQRIRRLDLKTHRTTTVAGNGQKAYSGDGGPAAGASLNMPHEIQFDTAGHLYIAERDNHVVRKVDAKTGVISTVAGTGAPGFSGDGGPAAQAQLRQPHSIAFDQKGRLLICDIGNHRIRQVDVSSGTIETYGGTGERQPTPDGAPVKRTPLNGPRTIAIDRDGALYLALREGNAIYRIASDTATVHHVAGIGEQGYSGDGGPARVARLGGPKGLALSRGNLYVADTENHVVRRIELETGIITTVLGTGQRGDGPEPDPLRCRLARPHGVFVDAAGTLYVGDSEAHRIRIVS
jgi:sugar lactone lactonase YvrE